MIRFNQIFLAILFSLGTACVSGESNEQGDFDLTAGATTNHKNIAAAAMNGQAAYKHKNLDFVAEWMACHLKGSNSTILVMNRDQAGLDSKSFCTGWIAQAALSQGKSVVGINRPGYGGSTGKPDFAGSQSIAALTAGVDGVETSVKTLPTINSIWGYSSGATAAAIFSRNNAKISAMVLGGGIFDTEEALATIKDSFIKNSLEEAISNEGDAAHEFRSIAWDTSGLPKRIVLYHGEQDQDIPADRARSFRDTLATAGYQVDIQVINGLSHRIAPSKHRSILEVLFRTVP